ncbi:MAG: acyl-[acyl-carrier-protein] thioesterase [Lachnospiraceae bacterium]
MYQMDARVRFSEVDENRRIKLISILDYFQDCCTFQSEDVGGGIEYLKERQRAWMLASWQVVIEEYPKLGDKLKVYTVPYEFKSFFGYRNLLLENEQGEIIAYANSNWIFVDTQTGKPVRIPEEIAKAYELYEAYPMEYAPRKIKLPEELEEKEEIVVHQFCIDTNHHVNNGKYVLLAEEYLPKDYRVRELRVDYRKAAMLGDVLHPLVSEEEEKITVALADEQKNPYAIVEFFGGKND